ncbi:MAG: hypothetical protein GQ532_10210 [Methylomarinum sp.]|nr:hypothetical protein [Methylomarinum sp.]
MNHQSESSDPLILGIPEYGYASLHNLLNGWGSSEKYKGFWMEIGVP